LRNLLRRLFGGAAPVARRSARGGVFDCEASGLDPARDRLFSIGAVAVRDARIELGDSFHAVLRQETPSSAENILVHRIGADAQRAGRPAGEALGAFTAYIGDGFPVAFHADFDSKLLGIPGPWLDLARLAPALYPESARTLRALDDWLHAFGIAALERHDALADAYATAQLLLVLLAEAERQRAATVGELHRIARAAGWLGAR
jgi:DNA polymerase-3 subunit epsilon